MLLLHHDSGLLLPMNAEGSNSVLYSPIRLGRVMGYMVRRYVIRSQKTVLCLNCRKTDIIRLQMHFGKNGDYYQDYNFEQGQLSYSVSHSSHFSHAPRHMSIPSRQKHDL